MKIEEQYESAARSLQAASREIILLKASLASAKSECKEMAESWEKLGQFIGFPGCTPEFIRTETVSLIEKLRKQIHDNI